MVGIGQHTTGQFHTGQFTRRQMNTLDNSPSPKRIVLLCGIISNKLHVYTHTHTHSGAHAHTHREGGKEERNTHMDGPHLEVSVDGHWLTLLLARWLTSTETIGLIRDG